MFHCIGSGRNGGYLTMEMILGTILKGFFFGIIAPTLIIIMFIDGWKGKL